MDKSLHSITIRTPTGKMLTTSNDDIGLIRHTFQTWTEDYWMFEVEKAALQKLRFEEKNLLKK